MTPEEMEEYGKKQTTITREEVARIIAERLAEEKKIMKLSGLSPNKVLMLSEIIMHFCADIMHEMFDDELEVEE